VVACGLVGNRQLLAGVSHDWRGHGVLAKRPTAGVRHKTVRINIVVIEDDEQIQISKVNGAIKNSVHVKHTKGSGNVGARLCEGFQLTNLRLACKKMAF
jgi:hypothetical protein